MPKEPSKNFFKYFIILFILNVLFSVIVYVISPKQVPLKLTLKGFEDYRNKIFILFPILFQLILLPIALISYKLSPPMFRIYPLFLQKLYMKFLGWLLGINPKGFDIEALITKYTSVLILSMSALLIPVNFIILGFSFEIPNLQVYLFAFVILSLVLMIPLFRIFSKKLQ